MKLELFENSDLIEDKTNMPRSAANGVAATFMALSRNISMSP